jgi:hypothetical protein
MDQESTAEEQFFLQDPQFMNDESTGFRLESLVEG